MNRQLQAWKLIADSIKMQTTVVLLYVLESKGSSPGRQGFFMCVNALGEMAGSIGGGIMEHKFVEMAKGAMNIETEKKNIGYRNEEKGELRKQIHDKSAARDRSGMICSGEQTIWIYRVREEDAATIDRIIECISQNKNGGLTLSPDGIEFSSALPENDFHFLMRSEEDWEYMEKIGYKNHLYIIGGGHCALALSKIVSMMDFYIHLFDEREGLNTMEQNEFVHEKKYVSDYNQLGDLIPSGEHHYVVIMTFGYRTDDVALRALLGKQFKYFGLLGSRKKIETMFEALRLEGVSDEVLNTIHSPVGIQIKSQTPEEIAISIAAQMIMIKNQ
jgi:xanthine dehydrogenase accessory factor